MLKDLHFMMDRSIIGSGHQATSAGRQRIDLAHWPARFHKCIDKSQDAEREQAGGQYQAKEVYGQLLLDSQKVHTDPAFEIDLRHARHGKGSRHTHHANVRGLEGKRRGASLVELASGQEGQAV